MSGPILPARDACRWALALALLLPLGWQVLASPARRTEIAARWRPLALLSLTGVGTYNALHYLALQTSTPLNLTLIVVSSPAWTMAIGAAFHGLRPLLAQLQGAVLSLAGVAAALARGDMSALQRMQLLPRGLRMLLAILSCRTCTEWPARPPALAVRRSAAGVLVSSRSAAASRP